MSKTIYFQPPGIKKQFCEAGMVSDTDTDYVWYYNEPCKVLLSDVKIIPEETVTFDKKQGVYMVN